MAPSRSPPGRPRDAFLVDEQSAVLDLEARGLPDARPIARCTGLVVLSLRANSLL